MNRIHIMICKRITRYLVCLAVFFLVRSAHGQTCGTQLTQKEIDDAIAQSYTTPTQPIQRLHATLPVTVWAMQGDSSQFTPIQNALETLNHYLTPIAMEVTMCSFHLVENPNYRSLRVNNQAEVETHYQTSNTLNIYLFDSIHGDAAASTYYPASEKDMIFVDVKQLNGKVLTHQFGHFMGLYHTHETAFGEELANQSNCKITGDLLCDTPADPNLLDKTANCQYNKHEKDTMGTFYLPMISNLMSFSNADCQCFFSNEQYSKMIYTYQQKKQHLH